MQHQDATSAPAFATALHYQLAMHGEHKFQHGMSQPILSHPLRAQMSLQSLPLSSSLRCSGCLQDKWLAASPAWPLTGLSGPMQETSIYMCSLNRLCILYVISLRPFAQAKLRFSGEGGRGKPFCLEPKWTQYTYVIIHEQTPRCMKAIKGTKETNKRIFINMYMNKL